MKESTGELNMTVVTVVAIAAIAAFFYLVVWPGMKANIERSQHCASAVCSTDCDGGVCNCTWYETDDDGNSTPHDIQCPSTEAGEGD